MVRFRKQHPPAGARPGTLVASAHADDTRCRLIVYSDQGFEERPLDDPDELHFEEGRKYWVDVQGLGDLALLQRIGDRFELHPLALEDVVNVPQRPKIEPYEDHELLIGRGVRWTRGTPPTFEQIAIFVGPNFVLTFQERHSDALDPVVDRLRHGKGRPIRRMGPDYLAYAVLDAVIDGYYPLVQDIAELLEEIEPRILTKPSSKTVEHLAEIKNVIVTMRRVLVPQREALTTLLQSDHTVFSDKVRVYLRDTLDHCTQLVEGLESDRELSNGLLNLYMSVVSHRTNEVMRVLTVVASVFIPLTFLAGVYGMNFENMPELQVSWAYPGVIGLMLLIGAGMLAFFARLGWISARRRDRSELEQLFGERRDPDARGERDAPSVQ